MWDVNEKGESEFRGGKDNWPAAVKEAERCPFFKFDVEDEVIEEDVVSCYNCQFRRWTDKSFACRRRVYDIAVIGAGITGTFIARELSRYNLKIVIIEKQNDVANGTTMANSGIIYEAFHSKPDKMKGYMIPRANELYDIVCEELDVPFKRVGSMMIGFDEADMEIIRKTYKKGLERNVPGMKILNKEEVFELEHDLNPLVNFALYSPSCGIISPFEMAVALAENAVDNGAELLLNSEVKSLKKLGDLFEIEAGEKRLEARYVINCAGLYADSINNMAAQTQRFEITPKKGQYFVLDKSEGSLVKSVIIQCKANDEKGVLLIPTVHNNIMIGPGLESVEEKEALETSENVLESVENKIKKTSDAVDMRKVIRSFSGINARVEKGDYIIEESEEVRGLINVAGINTPGLTCAPAIAEYVVGIVKNIFNRDGLTIVEKDNFNPRRKKVVRFRGLSDEGKSQIIKADSRYGRVVCRCEIITEGEIVDAIHRNAGATTVKGIKKRTSASMGRCQGGFCGPKIVEILARELGREMHEILYDNDGSYILTERE